MLARPWAVLAAALLCGACASAPDGAYFPPPSRPDTVALARSLHRAAQSAGDDPARYSFALVATPLVVGYSVEDATFYFSDGLARQPARVMDALVAHEVAHEVLGHAGQRQALSLSLRAGFTVLGVMVPGLSLIDLVANPLIVRAFTRDQEIAADLKAVEILRSMGYETPRRTMVEALQAVAAANGASGGGWLAAEPDLADRIAAVEPVEPAPGVATRAAPRAR